MEQKVWGINPEICGNFKKTNPHILIGKFETF
jgi:hypothetical protein